MFASYIPLVFLDGVPGASPSLGGNREDIKERRTRIPLLAQACHPEPPSTLTTGVDVCIRNASCSLEPFRKPYSNYIKRRGIN